MFTFVASHPILLFVGAGLAPPGVNTTSTHPSVANHAPPVTGLAVPICTK